MIKVKSKRLSLSTKRNMSGYLFTMPFIIGFIFLFLSPLLLFGKMSFSEYSATIDGMRLDPIGFKNYHDLLFVENGFLKQTFSSLGNMLIMCPAVLFFSFFIAIILNQQFKGRTFARVMFFLPFITTTGIIPMLPTLFGDTRSTVIIFSTTLSESFLDLLGIGGGLPIKDYFQTVMSKVYEIVSASSMQIIIFLAGLQTISPALYEASSIEGASAWENFWKITLPMVSPLIVVNTVYTLIDCLAGTSNTMITEIYEVTMSQARFGMGSAMSILYLGIIFIILGIIISIINRFVFYENA